MKIEAVDDATLGKMVKDRHARLVKAHAAGLHDTHPAVQWNADSKVLRATRDQLPGNVGEAKPIEDLDGAAQDDPGAFPGKPPGPQRNGASVAATDSAIKGYGRLGGNGSQKNSMDEDGIVKTPRHW